MSVIKVEHLVRNYSKKSGEGCKGEVKILKDLNFDVEEQEFVGIMGRSGCGKSTLLRILGLIDKPTEGRVYFRGKDTQDLHSDDLADMRRKEIGFVFQDYYLMGSLSVKENIMLPLLLEREKFKTMEKAVLSHAERFELTHLLSKSPYELSGGEQQRIAVCRALMNNPDLILADEPTGNLDSKSGQRVLETLEEINQQFRKTIVMVTHDPQMASHCNRVIFLKDGIIVDEKKKLGERNWFYKSILEQMERM